jgi:hypothetical protein
VPAIAGAIFLGQADDGPLLLGGQPAEQVPADRGRMDRHRLSQA